MPIASRFLDSQWMLKGGNISAPQRRGRGLLKRRGGNGESQAEVGEVKK